MSLKKKLLISFGVTLAIWLIFSWPLAMHFSRGIPSSAVNVEKNSARHMIQGDHLQLLYHYWLFSDMVKGKTPWLKNVYEFNTGNDEERHWSAKDNLPFSIIYTAFSSIGNQAIGWNIMGLMTLWVSYFFTWLLLKSYTKNDFAAALLSVIVLIMPYRWATLLGGSPTAYALMWIPVIMWGLDTAIRNSNMYGALTAGIALLFSYWNDSHVFFFALLLIPCWGLLVALHKEDFPWKNPQKWGKIIWTLLPIIITILTLVALGHLKKAEFINTAPGIERDWSEIKLFSPDPKGLFAITQWFDPSIYIGYILPLFLIAGWCMQAVLCWKDPEKHRKAFLFLSLFGTGIIFIIILALGAKGPGEGALLKFIRKIVSPYALVRQTSKILLVLPALMAVFVACVFNVTAKVIPASRQKLVLICLILAATTEYAIKTRPTICLLDEKQGAYEAIAMDAKESNKDPRVIITSFWPGDSSWASLYQYYVSLYRIRMINGYLPFPPKEYATTIFDKFGSINLGELSDYQLDELQKIGIAYVILHEDAFPQKVSPFPVCFTLKRFLNHPRLELLKQDQSVWAFKILEEPVVREEIAKDWNIFFPSSLHLYSEMEAHAEPGKTEVIADAFASGKNAVRFKSSENSLSSKPILHWHAPNSMLLLRTKGHGVLGITAKFDDGTKTGGNITVNSDEWVWKTFNMDLTSKDSLWVTPEYKLQAGSIDLDMAIFTSGKLPDNGSFSIPGPLFFHAGYTDLENNSVNFRESHELALNILSGPKLPLAKGTYKINIDCFTDAPKGKRIGKFAISWGNSRTERIRVYAGETAEVTINVDNNLPAELVFLYYGGSDIGIRKVDFTRLDNKTTETQQ